MTLNEAPQSTPAALSIPRIDLRDFPEPRALSALDRACREPGFFRLGGHGIDGRLLRATLRAMQDFFALPWEEKQRCVRTDRNPWGYYDRELTKNRRDWKEIFDFGPAEGEAIPQWPARPTGFESTLRAFYDASAGVAYRLLDAIERNLEVDRGSLAAGFGSDHTSFLRLNHYPPCDHPEDRPEDRFEERLGIGQHSDAGALTVLLHDDRPGLQVLHGGTWHTVEPEPEELVINIGDIVQVWSNDRYQAPLHRVLASRAGERYSAPFFFNPSSATSYAPVRGKPRYRPINWGEFRAARAAGDYADYGSEIQIRDFRV